MTFPTSVWLIRMLSISGNVCWKMSPHSRFRISRPEANFPDSGIGVSSSLLSCEKLRNSSNSSSFKSSVFASFKMEIVWTWSRRSLIFDVLKDHSFASKVVLFAWNPANVDKISSEFSISVLSLKSFNVYIISLVA